MEFTRQHWLLHYSRKFLIAEQHIFMQGDDFIFWPVERLLLLKLIMVVNIACCHLRLQMRHSSYPPLDRLFTQPMLIAGRLIEMKDIHHRYPFPFLRMAWPIL
ncbi:hypothetical protein D3C78_1734920 [compost metagenome]